MTDDTAQLTSAGPATLHDRSMEEPKVARRVGRYVVLERIGQGGMGLVLRAYDPKLRREIALKLLKRRTAFKSEEAQARMLREAQALARLSHPNVTAVYDADVTDLGMFIAMEYVEGQSLRSWLQDDARPWREALEVVLDAARGAGGGARGRDRAPRCEAGQRPRRHRLSGVRLTDFGLARERAGQDPSLDPAEFESPVPSPADSLADLTHVGTLLGTPPYLAPEPGKTTPPRTRARINTRCA